MLATGTALSSKAFVARRPVALAAPKAPRMAARQLVVAEAAEGGPSNKMAKASALRVEFPTAEAIEAEVQNLKAEMFKMRIKFAKREDYKPAQYATLRKRIAQLLTVKREREIEAGIGRREARAAERRRMVEAGLGNL